MILAFAILLITSLTIFVSPATVNTKRASSATVMADVNELIADVSDLNTAITTIPLTGSSLGSVVTAGMNGLIVLVTLNQLTTDAQTLAAPIDLADAQTILAQMTTLQPKVISIITAFGARKNTVEDALSGAGFFILTNFQNVIDAMIQALENVAPPEISRATIATLKSGIDNALTAALATFPSCGSLISISL